MALITKAIKGTKDVQPKDVYKNQYIEHILFENAAMFGFKEIRTPVFEHTELFQRGVGDTTDVVQKEMYTFDDKGGRSITLRPEVTAGAVRSFLENGLFNDGLPQKVCYLGGCYRYEKPQAGRLREFHQFGIECFGAEKPIADAEVIAMAQNAFTTLGVTGISLEINSIGCPECRKEYHKALKEFFNSKSDNLCETCKGRLERNPMRILDCKSSVCSQIGKDAPLILDYLCSDCADHFEQVQKYLKAMNIEFKINPRIVRGLDYYTRTVFEFLSGDIGSQSAVCAGGRYDGLVEQLGGAHTPSLGYALGIERLLLLMENQKTEFPAEEKSDLFIITMGEKSELKAVEIAKDMREEGFSVSLDLNCRSIRAQMKYADKIGARFSIVLGDEELKNGIANLKNMDSGETNEIPLSTFVSSFYNISLSEQIADMEIGDEKMDFSTLFGLGE